MELLSGNLLWVDDVVVPRVGSFTSLTCSISTSFSVCPAASTSFALHNGHLLELLLHVDHRIVRDALFQQAVFVVVETHRLFGRNTALTDTCDVFQFGLCSFVRDLSNHTIVVVFSLSNEIHHILVFEQRHRISTFLTFMVFLHVLLRDDFGFTVGVYKARIVVRYLNGSSDQLHLPRRLNFSRITDLSLSHSLNRGDNLCVFRIGIRLLERILVSDLTFTDLQF